MEYRPRSVSPSTMTTGPSPYIHPPPRIVTLRPSTSIQVLQRRDEEQKKEDEILANHQLYHTGNPGANNLHLHSMKYENHQIMTVTQLLLNRRKEIARMNTMKKTRSPRTPFVSAASPRSTTGSENTKSPFRIVDAIKEGQLEVKTYQKLLDDTAEQREASLAVLKGSMDERNENNDGSIPIMNSSSLIGNNLTDPSKIPPLPLSGPSVSSSTVLSGFASASSSNRASSSSSSASVTPFRSAVQEATKFQQDTFTQLRAIVEPLHQYHHHHSSSFSTVHPSASSASSSSAVSSAVRRNSFESISGITLNVSRFERNPIPRNDTLLPENVVKKIGDTKMTLKMLKEHYVYPFNIRSLTMDASSTIPKEDKKLYRIKVNNYDHAMDNDNNHHNHRNASPSPPRDGSSVSSPLPTSTSSPQNRPSHDRHHHPAHIENPNTISLKASSNEIKSRLKHVLDENYETNLLASLSNTHAPVMDRTVISSNASTVPLSVDRIKSSGSLATGLSETARTKSRYGDETNGSSIYGGSASVFTSTTSPRDRTTLYEDEDSDSEEQQRKRTQILNWYTNMNANLAASSDPSSSSSSSSSSVHLPPSSLQAVALQPQYIDIQFGASQDLCDRRIIERYLESAYEIFTDPGPPPPLILCEPQLNNLLHDCVNKFPLELLVRTPTERTTDKQKEDERLRAQLLLTSVSVTRLAVGFCHLIYWTILRNYYIQHSSLLYDLRRTMYNRNRLEQERLFRRLSLLQAQYTNRTDREEENEDEDDTKSSVIRPVTRDRSSGKMKNMVPTVEKKESAVSNSRGSRVMRRLSTILRSIEETEEQRQQAQPSIPTNAGIEGAVNLSTVSIELPSIPTVLDISRDDWEAPVPDTQLLITGILQEYSHIDDIFKGTIKLAHAPSSSSGSPNLYYLRSVVLLCVKIVTEAYLRSRYGYHFLLETALAEYSRRFIKTKTKDTEDERKKTDNILVPSQIVTSLLTVPPVHMQIDSLVAELLDPGRLANHLPLFESNISTRSVLRKGKVELKRLHFLNQAEKSKHVQKLHRHTSPTKGVASSASALSSSSSVWSPSSPNPSMTSLNYTDSFFMTDSGSSKFDPFQSQQRPSTVSLAERASTLGEKFSKSVHLESNVSVPKESVDITDTRQTTKNIPISSSDTGQSTPSTLPLLYYPTSSKDLLCTTSSHIRALVPHPQDPTTRKFLAHSMNYLQTSSSSASSTPTLDTTSLPTQETHNLPVSPMRPSTTKPTSSSSLINAQGSIAISSPLARTVLTRMSYERAAHRYRVKEGGVNSIQRLEILEDLLRHEEQAVERSTTLHPLTSPIMVQGKGKPENEDGMRRPHHHPRKTMDTIMRSTRLDTVLNSSWQNNDNRDGTMIHNFSSPLTFTNRPMPSTVQPLEEERKHDFLPTDEPFTYDEETENTLRGSIGQGSIHETDKDNDIFKNMKYMAIYEKRGQDEEGPKSAETLLLDFLKNYPVGTAPEEKKNEIRHK